MFVCIYTANLQMNQYISIKEHFDTRLRDIFDENGKYASLLFEGTDIQIVKRKFAIIEQLEIGALLFIGLNPSRGEIHQDDHRYYTLHQEGGNAYSSFWKPFEDVAKEAGMTWTHLDLLGVRETKQPLIRSILDSELGVDFIYQQLLIAKQILEKVKPKIIVVSNTLARRFFGYEMSSDKNHNVWMGFEFKFDDDLGTERIISEGPLKGTPVFFTSMLSGQRALDNGSEKRLIWHIKRVNTILDTK
jgi:hypothetical protein